MRTPKAAVLVAAAGVVVALVWAVTALLDQVQRPAQFSRADLPGEVAVELTQPGPHVIHHETTAGSVGMPAVRASDIEVRDPDGARVVVQPHTADLRYDHAGMLGTAVGVFTATRTGTYVISAPTAAGGSLAVGDDLAPGVVRAIALPALTALGSLALAAALVLSPARTRPYDPIT